MEAKAGARKGAKRKKTAGGKIVPLNMRTTAEIRQRMEKAAEANGRSLASEVEDRLLSSFNQDDILEAMFGNAELINLFRMLAAATDIVEQRTGKSWAADYETFVAVKTAWEKLINELRPKPSAKDRVAALEIEKLDPGPPPASPDDHARWGEQAEIYRARLQKELDRWTEVRKSGDEAAEVAMFPTPQGQS